MAFPQTSAPTVSSTTTDASSFAFTLPSTIYSGDLLLLVYAAGTTTTHGTSSVTDSTSDSWTELFDGSGTTLSGAVYAKKADGDEDGGTVTVTVGETAHSWAGQVYRITAWGGTIADDIDIAGTVSASANPDPPSVTAGWGSDDNLFFTCLSYGDDAATVSSYPTNYDGNGVSTIADGGANNSTAVASGRRELAADTDDPGTWTLSELEGTYPSTLVIKPGSSGGAPQETTIAAWLIQNA